MTTYNAAQRLGAGVCSPDLHENARVRRIAASVMLASALLLTSLAGAGERSDSGRDRDGGSEWVLSVATRPSHNGLYRAEVIEEAGVIASLREPTSWTVRVTHADGTPADDADIQAAMWMPLSGTSAGSEPVPSTRLGDGRYRIDGMHFSQPGWWNVPVRISSGAGVDSLAFNVVVPLASPDVRTARSSGGPS